MKVLDFNNRLILASLQDKAILLKNPSLDFISQYKGTYQVGSLQYETGIAVLGLQSFVIFYDFKYERKIQEIDTTLKLINIKILKNLVFCTSASRILIYDIATKNNICNISTSDGSFATSNSSYYSLRLMYPISPNVYHEQQIWANKTKKIQCSSCSIIKYDKTGQILCLAQENLIALYQNQEIIRGCSFQDKITHIVPSLTTSRKFYVRTQKNTVEQNKSQRKVLFIEVSVTKKSYLKLTQQQTSISAKQILSLLGTDGEILFEHQGVLYIGKNKTIYQTQIDIQPNLKGLNIQQWQKIKQQKIMVNSHTIQTEEEEVPRSQQVQKQLQAEQQQKSQQKDQKNNVISPNNLVQSLVKNQEKEESNKQIKQN